MRIRGGERGVIRSRGKRFQLHVPVWRLYVCVSVRLAFMSSRHGWCSEEKGKEMVVGSTLYTERATQRTKAFEVEAMQQSTVFEKNIEFCF